MPNWLNNMEVGPRIGADDDEGAHIESSTTKKCSGNCGLAECRDALNAVAFELQRIANAVENIAGREKSHKETDQASRRNETEINLEYGSSFPSANAEAGW